MKRNKKDDNMIKTVVWDWNGTLLNDVDLCIETINKVLRSEGIVTFQNKEEYQRVFQFPIIEYYRKAGFDFEKTSFEQLAKQYMEYYQPRSLACPLQDGSVVALTTLKEKGFDMYLLSASQLDFLHEQVQQYNIKNYFMELLGLDNIHAHSKAELAKTFVQSRQLNPKEVIFVGDSVHDFEVAQGAGCRSLLIANGHEHKEKLLHSGGIVVSNISEAVSYILKHKE